MLSLLPANAADEVDFVLGGHIPLDIMTEINGIPVMQPLGHTRGYADVTLTVDRKTKDVVDYRASSDRVLTDSVAPDAAVREIVDRYQAELNEALGGTVGEATTSILRGQTRGVESEMGNFVTASMRTYFTFDTQLNLVDTVVRYLDRNSSVDPQVEGRLTVE